MATSKNRHGLSRDIPSDVKLQIRRKSGFGCVICGFGIYDYEHVNPEFNDATEHDPNKMTLLCPQHHSLVTRRILPKSEVVKAMKNPEALKSGFSYGPLYYSGNSIKVTFGNSVFENVTYPISLGGIPMISVIPPEEDGPIRVSAIMADTDGAPMLSIVQNEWRASANRWDVKTEGNKLIIRNGAKNVGMRFRNNPDEGIVFETARIGFAGLRLEILEHGALKFGMIGGATQEIGGMHAKDSYGGIGIGLPPELRAAALAWIKTQGAAFGISDLR